MNECTGNVFSKVKVICSKNWMENICINAVCSFKKYHMISNNILYIQVQNALRSFAEIAENFPEDLKDGYKLSRALEATDESGKALSVKEFAKVCGKFVLH